MADNRITHRILGSVVVLALLAAAASAQPPTIGTLGAAEATHRLDARGASTASVTVSGTYSGTVSFEVISVPGAAAVTVDCATPAAPGTAVNSTTGTGVWVCPVAGMSQLQARMSAYTSGAATVQMLASSAAGQTVAAAGGGGSFDGVLLDAPAGDSINDTANNALRVNIVAGAGSGGTAIADDAPFTAAVTSVTPIGGVFDNTATDSVDEGDAGAVRISANRNLFSTLRDAAGNERGANVTAGNALVVDGSAVTQPVSATNLDVQIGGSDTVAVSNAGTFATQAAQSGTWNVTNVSGTVSLPTGASTAANQSTAITALQLIDNIPITIGSTTSGQSGALVMGAVTTAAPSYTTGQSAPVSLTTAGLLRVAIEAGAGSGGTALADDADFTAGTTSFTPVGGFYQSTVTACTDGDTCAARITAGRAVTVAITNPDGTAASYATDATQDSAASTTGPQTMAIARSSLPTAVTNADAVRMMADLYGRLNVTVANVCADHARVQTSAISNSTSGNVEIVALNGSDLIYVCGYSLIAGAATSVRLVYGTGTACATGETGLTGLWSLAANGGITQSNGGAPQFVVPAGNAFCSENSGANAIAGHVTYVRTAAP